MWPAYDMGLEERYKQYVDYVIENLEGWTVDSLVDFGSHAKGEAVETSDLDLAIYLHSDSKILAQDFVQESRYFAEFASRYPALYAESTEPLAWLKALWQKQSRLAPSLMLWGPWDIRWVLYRLAFETEGGNFLQLACGRPVYDRGFHKSLVATMRDEMPFHWNRDEDSGMIHALRRWCQARKGEMIRDLSRIKTKGGAQSSEAGKLPWIYPAVYAISHSIATLRLVEDGWVVWRKKDVLSTVEDQFPQHFESAQEAYWYKLTDNGRREFRMLLREPEEAAKTLENLTRETLKLFDEVWLRVDEILQSGRSAIRTNVADWKQRNDEIYSEFLSRYLG